MSIILTTILIVLCIQLCINYKHGFINSFLLSILIIPKNACIIGGIKFNIILLLFTTIISYIHRKKILESKNPYYKSVLFYFISTLILICFSEDIPFINQFAFLIKKWIEMFWLGLLFWNIFKSNIDFQLIIKRTYYCIIILSIYGIIEYILKTNIYLDLFIKAFPDTIFDPSFFTHEQRGILSGRIYGTTEHPLDWGQRFTILFMFFYFFREYLKKREYILIEILIFINVFLTGSRSSVVPIVIFLIIIFIHYYRKHIKYLILTSITILICFITFSDTFKDNETIKTIQAFVYFWDENKSNEVGIKGSSVTMRLEQLDEAIYAIDKKVYYGFGYGYVTNMDDDHYLKTVLFGFESIILKILVEQGIFGLFFYLVMFYMFISESKIITTKVNTDFDYKMLVVFILAYLLSLFLTGERRSFQLFFILLIIITNYLNEKKSLKE